MVHGVLQEQDMNKDYSKPRRAAPDAAAAQCVVRRVHTRVGRDGERHEAEV